MEDWTAWNLIQLMSPASGDLLYNNGYVQFPKLGKIQLMSPASGDLLPSILNPYPARCPETVSEGQEKKW